MKPDRVDLERLERTLTMRLGRAPVEAERCAAVCGWTYQDDKCWHKGPYAATAVEACRREGFI